MEKTQTMINGRVLLVGKVYDGNDSPTVLICL